MSTRSAARTAAVDGASRDDTDLSFDTLSISFRSLVRNRKIFYYFVLLKKFSFRPSVRNSEIILYFVLAEELRKIPFIIFFFYFLLIENVML